MLNINPPELNIDLTEEERKEYILKGAILNLRFFSYRIAKIPSDYKKVKKADRIFFDVKFEDQSHTLVFEAASKKFGEVDDTKKSTISTSIKHELEDFGSCTIEITARYVRGGNPKSKKNVKEIGKVELKDLGMLVEGKIIGVKFGDSMLLNLKVFVDRSFTQNFVDTRPGEIGAMTFSDYDFNFKEICGEKRLARREGFSMFNPESFDFMQSVNSMNDTTQDWLNKYGRHFKIRHISTQTAGGLGGYYGHKTSFRGLDATSRRTFNWCGRKAVSYNFTHVTYQRLKIPSENPPHRDGVRVRSRILRKIILENPHFNIELLKFQVNKLPEKMGKKIKKEDELIFNISCEDEHYQFVSSDMKRRGLELNKNFELADRKVVQKIHDIKEFPVEINVQYKRGKKQKNTRNLGTVSLSEGKDLLKYKQRNVVKIKIGDRFILWIRVFVDNPYGKYYYLQPRRFGRVSFVDDVSSFLYGAKDLIGFSGKDFGLEKSVSKGVIEMKKWMNGISRNFVNVISVATHSCAGIGAYATRNSKKTGMNNMAYNVTTVWYQRNDYTGKIEDFEQPSRRAEPVDYSPVSPVQPQFMNENGEEVEGEEEEILGEDLFREVPEVISIDEWMEQGRPRHGRTGSASSTASLRSTRSAGLPNNFDELEMFYPEEEEEESEEEEVEEEDDVGGNEDGRNDQVQFPMMMSAPGEPVLARTIVDDSRMLKPVSLSPSAQPNENRRRTRERESSDQNKFMNGCGDVSIRVKKKKKKKK